MSKIAPLTLTNQPPPNNSTLITMNGDHYGKPSRLEQMRAEYQQKILKQKEQKLIELYETNQRKALEKVQRPQNFSSNQRAWSPTHEHSISTILSNSHHRTVNSAGSNVHVQNHSRWDRSKPLAPLEHRSSDRQRQNPPPVPVKPQILRHRRNSHSVVSAVQTKEHRNMSQQASAPPVRSRPNLDKDLNSSSSSDSTPPPNLARLRTIQRQRMNMQRQAAHTENRPEPQEKKLTEFQRWQLEQDHAKAERLKHIHVSDECTDSVDSEVDKNGSISPINLLLKKKELMEALQQREAELLKLQRERMQDEEELMRKENEVRRQPEAPMLEKKQQTENSYVQEEHLAKDERRREVENKEKQWHHQVESQKQKLIAIQHRELNKLRQRLQEEYRVPSPESSPREGQLGQSGSNLLSISNESRPKLQKRTAVKRQIPSPTAVSCMDAEDLAFYRQAAMQEDAHGTVGSLKPCRICGRKFTAERIGRHQAACKNAHRKRKVLDPRKMRTSGTEMEKYINNPSRYPDPPARNSNWRAKRNDFIQAIRYAKKVSQIEKHGGNLASLPPPPPSENPDYVQCPHCSRRFNPSTAERHIPKCQTIRARPAPPKRR